MIFLRKGGKGVYDSMRTHDNKRMREVQDDKEGEEEIAIIHKVNADLW